MEMILSEGELRGLGKGYNLVRGEMRINSNHVLVHESVEGFLDLCKENNIKTVFYHYSYYDKEAYLITEELLRENTDNEGEYIFCKKWADQKNDFWGSLNFDRPKVLTMAAMLESMVLLWQERDEWMEESEDGKTALIMFLEENEEKMLDRFETDNDSMSLADELQHVLLADSQFRNSTNKDSRRIYLNSFIKKKENKKYLKLVKSEKESWSKSIAFATIVDRIYNEYRNACYKAKIQVGEELPEEQE